MPIGQKLALKLFLEGVEVPVISATVTFGVNQAATAEIQVPASSVVMGLLPRTLVHLFFYDDHLNDYLLLYSGELSVIRYTKTHNHREAVLVCQDFSTYWDLAKRYYYDDLSFNYQKQIEGNFQDGERTPYDIVVGPAGTLASIIQKPTCRTFPDLRGVLASVVRVLETMGGYHENGHTKGINDFFTAAQLRLKLYQQLGACPTDTSCQKLLHSKQFYDWVRTLVSQGGNLFSLRQMLEGLLGVVFYRWVSNPVTFVKNIPDPYMKIKHVIRAAPQDVLDNVTRIRNAIVNVLNDGYGKFGTLPDPDDTRLSAPMSALLKSANETLNSYTKMLFDRSNLNQPEVFNPDAESVCQSSSETAKTGADQAAGNALRTKALSLYKEFLDKYSKDKSWEEIKALPPQRLQTLVFLPDIFMCPPPRCNLIFPDMYERIDVVKDLVSEPTRLMVTTQCALLEGDPLFNKLHHFAPEVSDIEGKSIKEAAKSGHRFILPHEVFSGPTPETRWFADIRAYDPLIMWESGSLLKQLGAEQAKELQKERGIADPIPYLQHVSNFMLVQSRYSRRTCQLPMKFNPNLVAGVPCAIFDTTSVGGVHWLGVPVQISHTVSQQYASTTAVIGYLHGHTEDHDIMRMEAKINGSATKRPTTTIEDIGNTLDEIGEAKSAISQNALPGWTGKCSAVTELGGLNKQQKKLVSNANDNIASAIKWNDKLHKELTAGGVDIVTGTYFQAAFGDLTRAASLLKDVLRGLTAKKGDQGFVKMTFEDQVRPPWLSSVYMNGKIGPEVYRELYGVDSVIPSQTNFEPMTSTGQAASSMSDVIKAFLKNVKDEAVSTMSGEDPELIDPVTGETRIITTDSGDGSTGSMIETIANIYRLIKQRTNNDPAQTDYFIRTFTSRPIATQLEILGTPNIQFNSSGEVTDAKTMREGFHSKAFGDKTHAFDFEESVGNMDNEIFLGKIEGLNKKVDPRNDRRVAVKRYTESLATDQSIVK
jgi:hypothetical protein